MGALRRRGLNVQPFKSGPDYIDPAFHNVATARSSINLDTWAMSGNLILDLINDASEKADIIIAEGAMGLFDGAATKGQSGDGSAADLAAITGWPVVLVIDVARQAQTAAAVALGCRNFRDDLTLAGVILNNIASPRHENLVRSALSKANINIFGTLPRTSNVALPERHLGLVQAQETKQLETILKSLADLVETHMELDYLSSKAKPCKRVPDLTYSPNALPPPPGQRIALAQDQAFSFLYPHLLKNWRRLGAEVLPFSPLADETPGISADVVWLPGGYPELHAEKIANAKNFKSALQKCADNGTPIHGECGGYMVLGQSLEVGDGTSYQMVGLLSHTTSFAYRKLHLGYRRADLLTPSVLGRAGANLCGHEFHYATLKAGNDQPLSETYDANGDKITECGSRRGSVSGTFFHVISQVSQ